jgi:regulator of sigma E protease
MSLILDNLWSTFLIILFFGGSIFVHELGHFIAARRRGVHVERFSIGFGPAIWSWRGRDGVEYRIAWIPLGGYVLLPQLADLGPIEGRSESKLAELIAPENGAGGEAAEVKRPPIAYSSKIIVFAAGAFCNVLFALALATVLTVIGLPERNDLATTRIGYVAATLADSPKLPSPAAEAGLQVNDVVRAIDGRTVKDWQGVTEQIVLSAGHSADGRAQIIFTIDRGGKTLDLPVHPRLDGEDKARKVGLLPGFDLIAYSVTPGTPAALAGFQAEDKILRFDGIPMINNLTVSEYLDAHLAAPIQVAVLRHGQELTLTLPARPGAKPNEDLGILYSTGVHLVHPSPFAQVADQFTITFRRLWSLINPRSDIGLSGMAGPVGIVHIFRDAAESGIRDILMFTILLNVNLAIFNLLPIPVLDGGHMLFATIGRLRGRMLPTNFIMTTQSVFIVLLFLMVGYVSIFDVKRWARDNQADRVAPVPAEKP